VVAETNELVMKANEFNKAGNKAFKKTQQLRNLCDEMVKEVEEQEVSPACYYNLGLDTIMFPIIKPLVEKAMEDNKITMAEMVEIYQSQIWKYEVQEYYMVAGRVFSPYVKKDALQEAKRELNTLLLE
jgi:hypothetical protein